MFFSIVYICLFISQFLLLLFTPTKKGLWRWNLCLWKLKSMATFNNSCLFSFSLLCLNTLYKSSSLSPFHCHFGRKNCMVCFCGPNWGVELRILHGLWGTIRWSWRRGADHVASTSLLFEISALKSFIFL